MPNNTINFSWNWNGKLYTKCFTTIRLRNDHKYTVGNCYDIQLYGNSIGPGHIRDIKHFTLSQLNTFMAHIDTGFPLEKCKDIILTMYKNKGIDWSNQQLSFILIEQSEKVLYPLGEEYFENYKPKENETA